MDGGLTLALAGLADALGLGVEALGLGAGGESLGLASALAALESRARELAAGERRARQAAASFRAASLALSSSPDSSSLLEELLDYLNWIVAYDAAQVFLVGAGPGGAGANAADAKAADSGSPLLPRASREWRSGTRTPLALEAEALARKAGGRTLVEERGTSRYLYLPLRGPDGVLGEAVILREGGRPFDEEEVREAEAFAGQAAAALRNASLFEGLMRADRELLVSYDTSIEILSKTLDLRDRETEGHSHRVADMSTTLARVFGMSEGEVTLMRRGALLHDIGKIGIPDAILLKPAPLDDEERIVMRRHPTIARELFEGVPFLRAAIDVPWCHHERWDGKGYPRGLSGDRIPLAARVFAVVDVWDALTHDRPYRKALGEAESLDIIAKGAGSHFDPVMVQFFLSSFDLF
jgi:HD-GYP domain-containing protein (c-di-GMP phosphodiesterase class II)